MTGARAPSDPFVPLHVERRHGFRLPLRAARAFQCFTPEGERAWAPGWDPEFLHPADGALRLGTAFLTREDGEPAPTIWLVTALDPAGLRVSYARVTPASRIGLVRVAVTPETEEACRVEVSYVFTALTAAGNAYLAGLTEERYRAFIDSWREAILAAIAGGGAGPAS